MHIVNRIIAELGGDTVVANATGIPIQTINSWKTKVPLNIPHWRRPTIIEVAERLGKTLSPEATAYLTSSEAAQRKSAA